MKTLRRVLGVLRWLLLGTCLACTNSQRLDAEQAATVTVVSGSVSATGSNGVTRLLNEGDAVYAGDLIVTGADSVVDLSYEDGGEMTLRPLSRVSIDAYHFEASAHDTAQPDQSAEPGQDAQATQSSTFETAAFHLLKGGLRAVSGLIGHVSRDDYEMDTPTATIGIRGTAYDVRYCQDDCGDEAENGASPANGLYTQVNKGAIAVNNEGGESSVAEGQSAFANSRQQPSYLLQQPPAALRHMGLPPRLAERAAQNAQRLQQTRSFRLQQMRGAPAGVTPHFTPKVLTPRPQSAFHRDQAPRTETPHGENKGAERPEANGLNGHEPLKNESHETPKGEPGKAESGKGEPGKGEFGKGEAGKGEERKGEVRGADKAGGRDFGRSGRETPKADTEETPRRGEGKTGPATGPGRNGPERPGRQTPGQSSSQPPGRPNQSGAGRANGAPQNPAGAGGKSPPGQRSNCVRHTPGCPNGTQTR
jgi:hypothetical protein